MGDLVTTFRLADQPGKRTDIYMARIGLQQFVKRVGARLFPGASDKRHSAFAPFIHPLADVSAGQVGARTRIWQFVVALEGARIGVDCNICSHVFIENDVVIGDRVTVKNGVQLWDGLRVEDDVFIGPNVTFTNDKHPRSRDYSKGILSTTVEKGASIGGGAVILPGIRVGSGAMVGAGAVVTSDVAPNDCVVGNPARVKGSAGSSTSHH